MFAGGTQGCISVRIIDGFTSGSCEVGIKRAIADSRSRVGASRRDASFEFDGFGVEGSDGVEARGESHDGEWVYRYREGSGNSGTVSVSRGDEIGNGFSAKSGVHEGLLHGGAASVGKTGNVT